MHDPFPPLSELSARERLIARLRSAVDAAIRDGRSASALGPGVAAAAEPLVRRLEQIARELEQMEADRTRDGSTQSHPFWIDLLNQLERQTPCGISPPPENGVR